MGGASLSDETVFRIAQEMEKDGEEYYRILAEATGDEGLRNIFHGLADDEARHRRVLERMESEEDPGLVPRLILSEVEYGPIAEPLKWPTVSAFQIRRSRRLPFPCPVTRAWGVWSR